MPSNDSPKLAVVVLPRDRDGRPAANACVHLAEVDRGGHVLRFVRMTRERLLQADGGDAVLARRAERARLRSFLASWRYRRTS